MDMYEALDHMVCLRAMSVSPPPILCRSPCSRADRSTLPAFQVLPHFSERRGRVLHGSKLARCHHLHRPAAFGARLQGLERRPPHSLLAQQERARQADRQGSAEVQEFAARCPEALQAQPWSVLFIPQPAPLPLDGSLLIDASCLSHEKGECRRTSVQRRLAPTFDEG